jgi:hypothetical protein
VKRTRKRTRKTVKVKPMNRIDFLCRKICKIMKSYGDYKF